MKSRRELKEERNSLLRDFNYLKNKPIEDVIYKITGNEVNISFPSTSIINLKVKKVVEKDKLYESLKKLKSLCKDQKIKFYGYNAIMKNLETFNWENYNSFIVEEANLFEKIKEKAFEIKERGIKSGCSDDMKIKELHLLSNNYSNPNKEFAVTSYLSQVVNHIDAIEVHIKYNSVPGSSYNYNNRITLLES